MLQYLLITLAILHVSFAPPVTQQKKEEEGKETNADVLEDYIEYHRYIREVVNALESDPAFRDKLEKANEEDIRTGKIADELDLVSHNVRSQLDEIKRTELQRLRDLVGKKRQLLDSNEVEDPTHHHIDHKNPHTFEIEDLKKLITKTTEDLAEADKKRREEFKEYEMKKEYEKINKLNHTTGEEREKLEKDYKEKEEKHKKHQKLHTPGHKQQLEEVWEEQDHMQQEFNPKTFFVLHDLDSNGYWDQEEVKALFIKELDKMYAAGAPEDDMRERAEEMERMRESVFQEMDFNRDGFIDFNEFLEQTKRSDFNKDQGWEGLDEKKPFTDEEWEQYVQMQNYQQAYGHYPPGAYPPGAYQGHPNAYPPGHPNAYPPPPGHPNAYPPGHPNAYPPGHPQMQPHGGQMYPPGGQGYPQGNYPHGQGPPHSGEQFHPGQLPQAQVNPQQMNNQVPTRRVNPNQPNNNQQGQPDLNTNEIYPGAKQGNQPNLQQNQQQQKQFQQNQQEYQQNQQQYQKQNQPNQEQKQQFQQKQANQQPNLSQEQKQPPQQQNQGNKPPSQANKV